MQSPSNGLRRLSSNYCIANYAIGLEKLSANEQFLDDAQTAASLQQTIQIISDVSFITDHAVFASTDKSKIAWIGTELFSSFFIRGGWFSCLRLCLDAMLLSVLLVHKLQALVYDVDTLPSATAVFSYVIGSWKLLADEQFFVVAQTVVSLLQTTQIKQGVSFIATNKVYTIVWIETELFLLPGLDVSHVYVCAWALGFFHSHISTRTFRRAPTASADSCAEIKSAALVA